MAGGGAAEALEPAEGGLDAPAVAVAPPVVPEPALARAGDDRDGAGLPQVTAQPVGVVAAVGDQPPQAARRGGEPVGSRRWRCRASGGRRPGARGRGEEVDLRGLAAARRADGLRPRAPLPPCAERCALTQVLPGAAVSATQPASASAASMPRQKPRRDHLSRRLQSVVGGPYPAGQRHRRQPERSTGTMPKIGRRPAMRPAGRSA